MAYFFMPGEPLGRMWGNRSAGLPERIPYKESKNPFRQAWLGKKGSHFVKKMTILMVGQYYRKIFCWGSFLEI